MFFENFTITLGQSFEEHFEPWIFWYFRVTFLVYVYRRSCGEHLSLKILDGKKQEKTNFLGKNSNAIFSQKIGRKGLLKLLFYMFSRRTRIGPSGTPKKNRAFQDTHGKSSVKSLLVSPELEYLRRRPLPAPESGTIGKLDESVMLRPMPKIILVQMMRL